MATKSTSNFKTSLISILTILVFACSEVNQWSNNLTCSLTPGKELILHIDSIIAPNENYFQYLNEYKGKETMVFHIPGADIFKFYDLNTGKVYHETKYPTSAPGALNSVNGFHIHNSDSIFLSQSYLYRLILINSKFKKIDKLDLAPANVEFEKSGYIPKKGNYIQTADISSRSTLIVSSGNVIISSK